MPAPEATRRAFLRGVRSGAPFTLVVAPFGLVFGVVASEAGLALSQTIAFSVIIMAGAAQFAALQLMVDNAPILVVVLTGLAVNLRMAMYSAALTPYFGALPLGRRLLVAYGLVDQTYATAAIEFANRPALTHAERLAYFAGCAVLTFPVWWGSTVVGATLGVALPPEFALDFAVPITFLAIIAPLLRSLAHVAAAAVSIALALALFWMPFNTGLLVAALAAMLTGAGLETLTERRRLRLHTLPPDGAAQDPTQNDGGR